MEHLLLIVPLAIIFGFSAGFATGAYVVENSHADEMVCMVGVDGYTYCAVNGEAVCRTVIVDAYETPKCVWDV